MKYLDSINEKKEKTAIGLMSGTSVDGIDAVLLTITGSGIDTRITERAFLTVPYPQEVRQRLLAIASGSFGGSEELSAMNVYLGELSADACFAVCKKAKVDISTVDFIGSHGHTVFHAPNERCYFGKNIKSTLQIGEAAVIAERTGCVTVADFRVRDVAAGGAGAPLVPFTEYLLYREPGTVIGLQNIGGIGNITLLPADADMNGIIAFDTGPGNMLSDAWMQAIWQRPYDKDGLIAATGTVLPELLTRLLDHPYFSSPYPKSTGRELFSLDWLKGRLKGGEKPEDILRTLLRFTAQTIYDATISAAPDVCNLYVCGGGIRNPVLMEDLHQLFSSTTKLHSTAALNLDPQWVEAAAFGWLAACWMNKIPSSPHHATGAEKSCILGAGHYP